MGFIAFIYVAAITVTAVYITLPTEFRQAADSSKITMDTRSIVVEDYFESEMTQARYFLLGKGVNGFYKSELRSNKIGGRGTSGDIEVGYLQMILNVGFIYVIIMFLMSFSPSIRGITRSQNPLAVVAGIWVLIRLNAYALYSG